MGIKVVRPHHIIFKLTIFQEEQMYALAADCSIGSAGSAILMTHSRAALGEPALIYLKVNNVFNIKFTLWKGTETYH